LATAEPAGAAALGRERLERALAADELALFCQPIRALAGGRYPMAQVLVRLRGEERALLPPGEFLPVFEELELIPEIDRWVVRHVLHQLRRGSRIPALTVNLSSQTLADPSFPPFVAGELEASGVAPDSLLLEIDESDLATGMPCVCVAATALQRAGCRILIDSFGATGRSLSRNILEATVRISATLDIGLIGMRVEEQDVLLRLKAMGVGFVQGFGVHEPGPLERIAG